MNPASLLASSGARLTSVRGFMDVSAKRVAMSSVSGIEAERCGRYDDLRRLGAVITDSQGHQVPKGLDGLFSFPESEYTVPACLASHS